ncbi:MAG TPA: hypothetical protein VIJ18_18140 [Microbacteriaceae bacterium]
MRTLTLEEVVAFARTTTANIIKEPHYSVARAMHEFCNRTDDPAETLYLLTGITIGQHALLVVEATDTEAEALDYIEQTMAMTMLNATQISFPPPAKRGTRKPMRAPIEFGQEEGTA